MSNETFESLYKKYESMIYLFIKKYNGLLEADEIRQACLIAIVKAHNSYNPNTNMKFSNWIYQNMKWELYKEIRNTKHLTKDCVSLNTPIGEEEDTTLEEIIGDNKIDIESEIEDKIMYETYKNEIMRCLDPKKADVMILKFFDCMPNNYIEKVLDITGVSSYVRESRMTLIRKSMLFKEEYRRIKHVCEYSNPAII